MKRIKYKPLIKDMFSFLVLSEPLLAGNTLVTITLNTKELKFNITNSTHDVIAQGTAVSQQMLRKQAKQAAKDVGVVFEDEVRPRIKGVTDGTNG